MLGILAILLISAVLFVGFFPVGVLRATAENRLTARFGRPVTIGGLERDATFSFTPTILVRDIRVPQAAWAGTGDFARIGEVRVRIRTLPLLVGRFSPQLIGASGVRMTFVRDAAGRENWQKPDPGRNAAGGDAPRLEGLRITDTVIRYLDAKQDRRFTVQVSVDPRTGLFASGSGNVRGAAVRVSAKGAPITSSTEPWPFSATIEGPALAMHAQGTMETPLDTRRMTLSMTARAQDLKLIDAMIEAGLIRTQPVTMRADVAHDNSRWRITNLNGTIGRSDIAGDLTVAKEDGRTKLDGTIRSQRMNFDDLASDEGLAAARALERAQGPRIVPNLRVDIGKITSTDGTLSLAIRQVVSTRGPSSITSVRGTLTLDHQRLTVAPLSVGLPKGSIGGRVVVDQRGGARSPMVTLDLAIRNSAISALAGTGEVSGRVDGRIALKGRGETIRAAVGRSTGTIGLVARDGALPARMASLMGFDVARGLTTSDDARAELRCAVARIEMRGGRGRFDPLVIDTSRSQTRATGGVIFPQETVAATLTGAPKRGSLLRLPGSIRATGTLRDPQVVIPREVKSAGNIFKAIGRAITGHQGPLATDANCGALAARALR